MGKIGDGYGSEWNMLQYLGQHRDLLNQAIGAQVGGGTIDWLDFPNAKEWKGLDFLGGKFEALRRQWEDEWPQNGNVMNWDAVGWMNGTEAPELVLVEAKSHIGELKSECGAKAHGGLPKIRFFLDRAKPKFGAPLSADWLRPHYQYCNRLAVLDFLRSHGIPTKLVLVYFTGDRFKNIQCPKDGEGWTRALLDMKISIGLSIEKKLEDVYEVFLPAVK